MLRFVLRASYGNDSVALVQWARENKLDGVTVLYSDTGWARAYWIDRVAQMEEWVRSIGYATARTSSVGMEALVAAKQMWPQRLMQFCTKELKILPSIAWLLENDPDRHAVILTGVRKEESAKRATAPAFILNSANDGGRVVISPLVDFTEADRDALLQRAGFDSLPHRSDECLCINSGREDIKRWDEADIARIEERENSMGVNSKGNPYTMFRPNKFMGATGIREVVKWAHSARGKYEPPEEDRPGCDVQFCER